MKLIFLCYKYKYLYRYLNESTVLGGGGARPMLAPLVPPLCHYGNLMLLGMYYHEAVRGLQICLLCSGVLASNRMNV
jgi:hypothetical protein